MVSSFAFIGTFNGQHNFVAQDNRTCKMLVHYEKAENNCASGASGDYKLWHFYKFENAKVKVVPCEHEQHGKWLAKFNYAKSLQEQKRRTIEYREPVHRDVEPVEPAKGLTPEQIAKLREMDKIDAIMKKLAPIFADHTKVSFNKHEKALLGVYKKYIPEQERAWVEYVLSAQAQKKDTTPVCPC